MENLKWAQQVNRDIEADQRRQAALASRIAAETANATNTDDEDEAPQSESDEEAAESEYPDNNEQDERCTTCLAIDDCACHCTACDELVYSDCLYDHHLTCSRASALSGHYAADEWPIDTRPKQTPRACSPRKRK